MLRRALKRTRIFEKTGKAAAERNNGTGCGIDNDEDDNDDDYDESDIRRDPITFQSSNASSKTQGMRRRS